MVTQSLFLTFCLRQINQNSEHSVSCPLSWEQKKTQMDAVCCPLFPTATCSSNIFSHFLDQFDILGSHTTPPPSSPPATFIPHPTPFSLPLPSPLPPLLPSRQGVPAEDHCLRSEGPLIAGLGARGGVDRINPTDSTIWSPLCLMTMLAFHMQPNRLDQICSIDRDARTVRGPGNTDTCTQTCATVQCTLHEYTGNVHTHKYKKSLQNTKAVIKYGILRD